MIKQTYYDNLNWLEEKTGKEMLTMTDVATVLKIDRKTAKKRYEKLFIDGFVSVPVLARALTP